MPSFVSPQLSRIVEAPASGKAWIHEIKFDGYRMQLRVEKKHASLLTRKELDWSHRFPEIIQEAHGLPDCIIDGEVVALDEKGISTFAGLQTALSEKATGNLVYFAFDLLFLNGNDFRQEPLTKRKMALAQLLKKTLRRSHRIQYVEHFETAGPDMLDAACKLGLEGIISKRVDAPYRSGRGDDWTKAKCRAGQEVVIGGWWGDANSLRSLLVGVFRDREFAYLGRVGTGYNQRSAAELLRKLKPLERPRPAFVNSNEIPRGRGVHWVDPTLVAEVEFGTITAGGILRQASFKGLREDKPAKSVVLERRPSTTKQSDTVRFAPRTSPVIGKKDSVVAGITITNAAKELWPATQSTPAATKLDLARYYEMSASRILPHIAGRPLSIVRAPDGIGGQQFFQRHILAGTEKYVRPIKVAGAEQNFLTVDSVEGLVALAQAAVLELHPWGSKKGHPEVPDRIIFDLDPAPDLDFDTVVQAARDMRKYLTTLGLFPFAKTTGGKGIHVVAAVRGSARTPVTWPDAKDFARRVCLAMERDSPDRYTINMSKRVRGGKIFLDFLRNDRMATAVAPYSPRARPGATMSMPVPWPRLRADLDPTRFNLGNAKTLLRESDPWKDFEKSAVSFEAARKKLSTL